MATNLQEVLLLTEDITVLGPPTTLDVLIDIGPEGQRGSQIFVGVGDPNIVSIGQTPVLNDLYINASPGVNYGYMYQYLSQPGGNTWVEVLRVSPVIYSTNYLADFVAGTGAGTGSASITIPISDIVTISGTPLEASDFSVRYSIANVNPVASSMQIPPLVGLGDNLVINIEATEFSGGSWQALEGEITVHLFISILS